MVARGDVAPVERVRFPPRTPYIRLSPMQPDIWAGGSREQMAPDKIPAVRSFWCGVGRW